MYENEDIYLKYVKPRLAIPLFYANKEQLYVFELEDLTNENIKFDYFNRPDGTFHCKTTKGEKVRLPHAFCCWSNKATESNYCVTDV